jgi:anthranilate synthase component 1
LNRFDAFRSIFPAGTVSGAPKIRAIELIQALELERRGVYAGAVGHFDFAGDSMDTCIAIRTMVFKQEKGAEEGNNTVYLQAGGGIVFDSVEEDEYIETINKLGANVRCLEQVEGVFLLLSHSCSAFRRCHLPRIEGERRLPVRGYEQH